MPILEQFHSARGIQIPEAITSSALDISEFNQGASVSQQSAKNAQRILIVDDSPYNLFVL